MRTEIIDNWDGLARLEAEWNALLQRSRADCPFLTWEWVEAWRGVVEPSVQPMVVVVRDTGGALVGVGPFYVGRMRLGGVVEYRSLRILGDYDSGAEYLDWIVRKDCESEAAGAIAQGLADVGNRWDCLWMPYVSGWTGARERLLAACAGQGFHWHERPCEFAACDLSADYADYERSLSANARSTLQRQRRHVMALPGMRFERCEAERDRPAFLDALFHLHGRRWVAAGQEGTFVRKPLSVNFYREFTRRALDRGWLRFFALKAGDEFKAVQVGYVYGRTFYQLQEGFDPTGPPGIGNVLRSKVIEQCIAEGVKTYDFLGGFTEHKRRWHARLRVGHDLFIGRRGGVRNALLFAAEIWPTGRYLRRVGFPAALAEDTSDGRAACVAAADARRPVGCTSQKALHVAAESNGCVEEACRH